MFYELHVKAFSIKILVIKIFFSTLFRCINANSFHDWSLSPDCSLVDFNFQFVDVRNSFWMQIRLIKIFSWKSRKETRIDFECANKFKCLCLCRHGWLMGSKRSPLAHFRVTHGDLPTFMWNPKMRRRGKRERKFVFLNAFRRCCSSRKSPKHKHRINQKYSGTESRKKIS